MGHQHSYKLGPGVGAFGVLLRNVARALGRMYPTMQWEDVQGLAARSVQEAIRRDSADLARQAVGLAVEDWS